MIDREKLEEITAIFRGQIEPCWSEESAYKVPEIQFYGAYISGGQCAVTCLVLMDILHSILPDEQIFLVSGQMQYTNGEIIIRDHGWLQVGSGSNTTIVDPTTDQAASILEKVIIGTASELAEKGLHYIEKEVESNHGELKHPKRFKRYVILKNGWTSRTSNISNNYNDLADSYQNTDAKPDKKYSILPTVLMLAGNLSGKLVLDLGCGSGFFTRSFAIAANRVIGIDNSSEQIVRAKQHPAPNVDYILADIMKEELPSSDVVNAPFVLGYCSGIDELKSLFVEIYRSLNHSGCLLGIVDLPSGEDLKRYGATKILHGKDDGSKIEIILSDGVSPICTLWATYFSPETITSLLTKIGFQDIEWHKPIISDEGMQTMPSGYWDGYIENSELGYFTATKK